MIHDRVLMEEMSWIDFRNAMSEGYIVILPVGAIEQHGPHLPLGTDLFIPLEISKSIASQSKAIVAPPIPYGCESRPKSGGGPTFPGEISISGSVFINLICDVAKHLLRHGCKKLLVMNWHWENAGLLAEGVEKAVEESGRNDVKAVIVYDAWDLVSKRVIDFVFPEGDPGQEIEHASVTETSLMELMRPELVDREKIKDDRAERWVPYEVIPPPSDIIPKTGVFYRPTLASREKGEDILKEFVKKLLMVIEREFG